MPSRVEHYLADTSSRLDAVVDGTEAMRGEVGENLRRIKELEAMVGRQTAAL